jgi:hypothetical protein
MVETVGSAPTATILQGSSAPLCCPHGAEGWFRANLPASSARCFHQISFLGELERPGRIELLVGALATLCSTIELQPHGGKWTESNLLPAGTAFTARRRHQPVLMALPIFGCGPRGCTGPSRRMRPRGFLTDLPAQIVRRLSTPSLAAGTSAVSRNGGCLTCRSPHLAVPSRFERAPEAALVRHP